MWLGPLNLLEVTLPTIEENLGLDEALLLATEEQGGAGWLRLWLWPNETVIVGSSSRIADEVELDACRRDGVGVVRRCSGGGVVLLGPGCLLYTLVLPIVPGEHLQGIKAANEAILGRIAAGLQPVVPGVEMCGTSDLAIGGRKVSGNSQRWLRRTLLHHGTLLYDFPAERVSRYLKSPSRQPEYRGGRSHADFLTNLPVGSELLRAQLIEVWQGRTNNASLPLVRVAELVRTKYATDAWNLRR